MTKVIIDVEDLKKLPPGTYTVSGAASDYLNLQALKNMKWTTLYKGFRICGTGDKSECKIQTPTGGTMSAKSEQAAKNMITRYINRETK